MIRFVLVELSSGDTSVGCVAATAQDANDWELARQLANDTTRQSALASLVASGNGKVPLLLSSTRIPPAQFDEIQMLKLKVGLADAFARLKTREAIPFLIKNISLQRWPAPNTWMKSAQVIEERMPAVAALIQIGSEAYEPLVSAYWEPTLPEDRLAIIFAVSRIASTIKDTETIRVFLSSALGHANLERSRAEEGLKFLDGIR